MRSVFKKVIIALLAIVWGVSSMKAQVNMSNYITLPCRKGMAFNIFIYNILNLNSYTCKKIFLCKSIFFIVD